MNAPTFRYRAFLSYSHADKALGERLHHAIEHYAVPAGLTASDGSGPVPAGLRPIFRDKFDLEAGHSLREQIRTALAESDALIVLCSPNSARSPYVNEEIRLFKMAGRAQRIFPVIVGGRPGDPDTDCFAPMLRNEVAADGAVGGACDEPIAADVRDEADGWELATLKVIAGILRVDLDQLRRRDDIERRRKLRRSRMLAAAMAVLALAASGTAAVAWKLNKNLEVSIQNEKKSRKEAENRYEEALNSTLKLVAVAASLRSIMDPPSAFYLNIVEEKGGSDDFNRYLKDIDDQNRVWFGLVKVLMRFEKELPPELRHFSAKLEAAGMPLQWARHAQLITTNLIRRNSDHADRAVFEAELEKIQAEVARLTGGGSTRTVSAAAAQR